MLTPTPLPTSTDDGSFKVMAKTYSVRKHHELEEELLARGMLART